MAAIKWCKNQKNGIKLIEPNKNLFQEYIQTAEETLDVLRSIKGKSRVWLASTKYYCEYFSVYALLMRIGIKCEIHECTISVCQILEQMGIMPENSTKILQHDKKLRIDNQYYLKNREVDIDYNKMVEFVIGIKNISIKLTEDKINAVRERINKA